MTGGGFLQAGTLVVALLCGVVLAVDRPPRPRSSGWSDLGEVGWRSPVRLWPLLVVGVVGCGVLVSPALAVAAPIVSVFVVRELARKRRRSVARRDAGMTLEFVELAAGGLRAGRSLPSAVLGGPVGVGDGRRVNRFRDAVCSGVARGRPFADAVDEAFGGGSVDARLVAVTISALHATGAAAGPALERVSASLGERQSSREDARTQAQQALSSAGVLAALPLVFGLAAAAAEPEVAALYLTSWVGAGCVGLALLLIFGSWEWLQRLLADDR